MTTQYTNPKTLTSVTIEVLRDESFEAFLADNSHLDGDGDRLPQDTRTMMSATWRFESAQGFAVNVERGSGFDGLLYDHRQHEYDASDFMLDEDDLMQGEIEDAHYDSLLGRDLRTETRNAVINQKKFDGWFRPGRAQRRSKRNRKDIARSKALNKLHRSTQLVEVAAA